jgi:hypothetical protein
MDVMTKCGIALAISIGVFLPSSAWAISQGASCRLGARAQHRAVQSTLVCGIAQDPWQDCDEDPWQLISGFTSRDTFLDPWQDSGDPWQPFVVQAKAGMAASARPHVGEDPWQVMRLQVVKLTSVVRSRDSGEDPWQPAFADPWQDDLEDPWQ